MSEAQAGRQQTKPVEEDRDFREVAKTLVGKTVTIVNPESYEAAPMGYQLKAGFYSGKIAGWGRDYLIFLTVVAMAKKEGGEQPVQQFIPFDRLKRISVTKTAIYLHI